MLHNTHRQGNANRTHNEIAPPVVRTAVTRKTEGNACRRGRGEERALVPVGGNVNRRSRVEKPGGSSGSRTAVRCRVPASGNLRKGNKSRSPRDVRSPVLTATSFTTVKTWKQAEHPSGMKGYRTHEHVSVSQSTMQPFKEGTLATCDNTTGWRASCSEN